MVKPEEIIVKEDNEMAPKTWINFINEIVLDDSWNEKGKGIFGKIVPDGIKEIRRLLLKGANQGDDESLSQKIKQVAINHHKSGDNQNNDVTALYEAIKQRSVVPLARWLINHEEVQKRIAQLEQVEHLKTKKY